MGHSDLGGVLSRLGCTVFVLEDGKQTIACAPYSHDNVEPAPAANRETAQEVCAKVDASVKNEGTLQT